ncbi:MAG: translocation/assembly module TamB domain-containing protein [Candidatus Binatia bacterium]|nr:translocation/assembly module TamB domain-containing protein [Candidatus Binatia bacterium]
MKRQILRVSGWILIGLATFVCLAVVAVGIFTRTAAFHRWCREQLVALLQPSIHGTLTLEGVSGSVWTQLSLHNLSIHQDGRQVVHIPQAALTVSLLRQLYTLLWSGSLHIAALDVTAPQLSLWQAPDGTWNISRLFHITEAPQEPALLFQRVRITDGRLALYYATGEEAHLSPFSLAGEFAVWPTGTQVHLTRVELSFAHPQMPPLQASGGLSYDDTISPPTLRLQDVAVRTPRSQLRMAGILQDLTAPTIALTASVEQLAAADVRAIFPALPLQADLSGQVEVNGPLADLQVRATLGAATGQITTAGVVNLATTPLQYHGQVVVEHLALEQLLLTPYLAGEVRGRLTVTGTGTVSPQATLEASASRLRVHGWSVDALAFTGELRKEELTLRTTATSAHGNAQVQGRILLGRAPQYELTAKIDDLVLARVVPEQPSLTGQLTLDLWAQGSGLAREELDGRVHITVHPSRVGPVTITHGEARAAFRQGRLILDLLQVRTPDAQLAAHGTIGVRARTPEGQLTYTAEAKNLTPWLALLGYTGAGHLQAAGTVQGTAQDLRCDGQATVTDLRLDSLSVRHGTTTWTLAGIGRERPQGRVTATGTEVTMGTTVRTVTTELTLGSLWPLDAQAAVHVQMDDIRTLTLEAALRYDQQRLAAQLRHLSLRLPSGMWHLPQAAQLTLQDDAVTLTNFQLHRGDQFVRASGVVSRRGTQNFQLQVQRLPLAELHAFFAPGGPAVDGTMSAEVSVRGTAASPTIAATLATDGLMIAGQPYAGLTAVGLYQHQSVRVQIAFRQDAKHVLTVEGSIPLSLGWEDRPQPVLGEADLRVRSDGLSLAFLNLFSKAIREVQGTLSVDVRLRGRLDAPMPTGEIKIQQGRMRLVPLGTVLQQIELQLGLTPDAIQLARFDVAAGRGQLTGSGKLTIQGYTITALDLTLNTDRFRVLNTPEYTVAVSGQVLCSGSLQSPVVRGALRLRDTTLRPNLAALTGGPPARDPSITVVQNLEELALRSQREDEAPIQQADRFSVPQVQHALYRHLRLDLSVTIPRDTWIQMHDGSIELTGQVQVRKNPLEDLTLTGQIETVRGWYAFYGRQFQIERGRMTFTGGTPITPTLEVIARYSLPRYKVDVIIGGTADTPTLTLQSDPPLDQADILSLLAFGKPANALNQGERVSLQAQVLQATAGYLASDLRQTVAERLGLDRLELNVAEGRLGIGTYVTKDVFVSTSQQLGGQQKQEVSVEYQLDTDWQLKASTTSQGDSSIDLFWRKRY